jgi:hypothetical protein
MPSAKEIKNAKNAKGRGGGGREEEGLLFARL